MSGRPETLFPLFAGLETLPGVGPKSAKLLAGAGWEVPRDLLFHLPASVIDRTPRPTVAGVPPDTVATVAVTVRRHHAPSSRGRPHRVDVEDEGTMFRLVFFHARGDWIARQLPVGESRVVSGRIEHFDGMIQIVHPDWIVPPAEAADIPRFEPVYGLTQGVGARTMRGAVEGALARAPDLAEWVDSAFLEKNGWPGWKASLEAAHHPTRAADVAPAAPARMRLAYDEFFAHQVTLALARGRRRARAGHATTGTGRLRSATLARLPYRPTDAQDRAAREIADDMASERRMNRLLQGDVGAGKTLVALMSLLVAVEAGGQGVLMAPTGILARQHLSGLRAILGDVPVRTELLTGRDKGAERTRKLDALAAGEIDILVGTHAVFQDDVRFHDLRLAVVDEQHRFGVNERMRLGSKGARVDVLVMTATPIPRSLSLAQYGDMDVSILDEKPPGRTPVTTALVSSARLGEIVEHLRRAVGEGRQAYWVCPLVEESETLEKTAAEERFGQLRAALGEDRVALVHGQMPDPERNAAMAAFAEGRVQVLVATTVIEVGVDVPNASIMVIEGADGFGLAQLHQLRGRVGRGAEKSTCLLMYTPPLSEAARRRLELLRETEDGFRIAEEDLAMRGAGDVLGTMQSGLPKFRVADLERQAGLMQTAQTDARALLERDPTLEGERGLAVRALLWLLGQDQAIRMISVG